MQKLIYISLLFTLPVFGEPTGSVTDAPQSIRSFRPVSTPEDEALRTYFEEAGPLAIEFFRHLSLLSNPWLGGRQPGSEGSHIAGDYIVWNLENFGLTPLLIMKPLGTNPSTFKLIDLHQYYSTRL